MSGPKPSRLGALTACLLLGVYADAESESSAPDDATVAVPSGLARWFNPATAPFIPVPEISVDPVNGTTLGLIPTWVKANSDRQVTRIVAPDILHSEYFGWGTHARIYGYDSFDQQWSLVAGIKERVEREFVGAYQIGRARETLWSLNSTLIYDVDGTPRFYGIGNHTSEFDQSNYTSQTSLGEVQVGLNINHRWRLQYTARLEVLDVLPGTLAHIDSIQTLFPGTLGTRKEMLNRVAVVYDSRDDTSIPTRGTEWVAYYGGAGPDGLVSDGYFRETGTDGRVFWPVGPGAVLSTHVALRYLIDARDVPFWALSSVGGSQSVIGGEQTLRAFGEGRFYDKDYFATSFELRRRFLTVDAVTTVLDLEVTPFIDLARVFSHRSENPLESLHRAVGVGFRGVARPFVVGYVDVGYGTEGAAVFTGLNYPF
ncbi:MAG TPA: BamA/TamA family outer membrane protein [Steroidobacteraceae bacterium]|nr:BamA/TamA family outer membrane protein [Steroidobacteraceae bacterium]